MCHGDWSCEKYRFFIEHRCTQMNTDRLFVGAWELAFLCDRVVSYSSILDNQAKI
jgi:hypothetical protein